MRDQRREGEGVASTLALHEKSIGIKRKVELYGKSYSQLTFKVFMFSNMFFSNG